MRTIQTLIDVGNAIRGVAVKIDGEGDTMTVSHETDNGILLSFGYRQFGPYPAARLIVVD
jgi:hypothetical protein